MTSQLAAAGVWLADSASPGAGATVPGLLSEPFMRHALGAGLPIAVLAGLVGYFLVLRDQVFTADALSHAAFTGALIALAFGLDLRWGLFAATVGVGVLLGVIGDRGRADDVVIGTAFAWVLGLGVLALSVYTASAQGSANGAAGVTVLFGSIFGISTGQAWVAGALASVLTGALIVMARPLLFVSLDEAVAAARGVPVRLLGVLFLSVVGAVCAEATQVVGALLLVGLLAAPAAAAHRLTTSAYGALWRAPVLSVVSLIAGLALSYQVPVIPPSFGIVSVATMIYIISFLVASPMRQV